MNHSSVHAQTRHYHSARPIEIADLKQAIQATVQALSLAHSSNSDQFIGCFAQDNRQKILTFTQDHENYRTTSTVETRSPDDQFTPVSLPRVAPLVVRLFPGLKKIPDTCLEDLENPAFFPCIGLLPFRWTNAAPSEPEHFFNYSARVEICLLDENRCTFKAKFMAHSAPAFDFQEIFKIFSDTLDAVHRGPPQESPPSSFTLVNLRKLELQKKTFELLSQSEKKDLENSIAILQNNMAIGNCYLANLTKTVQLPASAVAEDCHHFLERWFSTPSRFGWFIQSPDLCIESYSPERFILISGSQISTEPIKGTAKVSSHSSDFDAAQSLWSSEKERAEQHLVVDLLRNDLAKVCKPGTVRAERLFDVRIDNGLAQMSSRISGTLKPEQSLAQIFAHIFPPGSVTGTPKRMVGKILTTLEPIPRGYYCGACVDFEKPEAVDATLLIRTLFQTKTQARQDAWQTTAGTGAGITVLSKPEQEVAEIEAKLSSFLFRCMDR